MYLIVRVLLIFAIIISNIAHTKSIRGVNIVFKSPNDIEELCEKDFSIWQYVSLTTHSESHLLTCYIDEKEWRAEEGTEIYKIEIVKKNFDRNIIPKDYPAVKKEIEGAVNQANNAIKNTKGKISSYESDVVEKMKSFSNSNLQAKFKKGIWNYVSEGENYQIYASIHDIEIKGKKINAYMVMAFLVLKGKLLTLKANSTKSQDDAGYKILQNMKIWIQKLNDANK